MLGYILLSLLNGIVIGTSRAVNGRLAIDVGAFKASLWNHVVGFLFLTLMLVATWEWKFEAATQLPWFAFLGGLFGSLFVAVNSYVFPRIGAMSTTLLVISGQMISAILIDANNHGAKLRWTQCIGAVLIMVGVYLSKSSSSRRDNQHVNEDKDVPI